MTRRALNTLALFLGLLLALALFQRALDWAGALEQRAMNPRLWERGEEKR